MVSSIFEFGDFKLDSGRFELSRAGRSVKLERKPMELLILLAARNDDLVTRTEIAERLWDKEVFVDTEHGINTAIRKIRHVLGDDFEEPRFVQTVMGKGYRFVGAAVAVEAAPAEIPTPLSKPWPPLKDAVSASGAALELPGAGPAPVPRKPRLLIWIAPSAVLALLIVGVGLRAHGRKSAAPKSEITSLAVLPLDNLSGDPAQNYFADGMTDELTTMLARNSTLRIVSRTSAMQYKGAHRPLRDIARALGVDGVIEGSVARADGKVHMTLQLIDAPTDTHLWADSYDRSNNDVAALPGEAAQAIAKRLNSSAPMLRPARYVNPEAHDAYLRGMYLFYTNGDASGPYFKKAIELQPDYALGWAGLSGYYGSGAGGTQDPQKALEPMEAAARKAVELDDTSPEAHLALGAALFANKWDWAGADRELLRAIELDPQY
ncbi:MAG TPA: winged helix-turn-helix domain-containing protein, partial [Chloroflexota bacterium]|nr:winged helix-turn-helix domain-containing protein [Chloroflexota bacterium]